MDIKKEYSCIEKNNIVYHKTINIDENYQESLESYLDDILKVVKCVSRNVITSCDVSQNEILIKGKTIINLTYCNSDNDFVYTDFEEEFTKSVAVDEVSADAFVTALSKDRFTSFRVINQRRIDIVTSFCVDVKLYDKASCPCVKSCEKSKLRTINEKVINVTSSSISKIDFDEEFSVTSANDGALKIVSISSNAVLNEVKTIKDKFLIRGNISVCVLFSDLKNELNRMEYSFEISKIVEMFGVKECSNILVKLSVGNVFAKIKNEEDTCRLELFGEIYANSIVVDETTMEIVTDGYIIGHNSNIDYSNYELACDGCFVSKDFDTKLDFELSSDVTNISELDLSITDISVKNNKMIVEFSAKMLNKTDDKLEYIIASSSFEYKSNFSNDVSLLGYIKNFDYTIQSKRRLCFRICFTVHSCLYQSKKISILSEIKCDEKSIEYPALSLYFAKANESLWDIAKAFSSDIALIQRENDLKADILDANKVLIIPGL